MSSLGDLWLPLGRACKTVHWTGKSSHANDPKLMVQRGIWRPSWVEGGKGTALDGYGVSEYRFVDLNTVFVDSTELTRAGSCAYADYLRSSVC